MYKDNRRNDFPNDSFSVVAYVPLMLRFELVINQGTCFYQLRLRLIHKLRCQFSAENPEYHHMVNAVSTISSKCFCCICSGSVLFFA